MNTIQHPQAVIELESVIFFRKHPPHPASMMKQAETRITFIILLQVYEIHRVHNMG